MLLLLYTWPAPLLDAWKFRWQETDKRPAGTLRSYVYNARCSVKQMVWRRLCVLFVLTSCYGPLTFLSHISLLLSILRFLRLNFAPLPLSLSFCRLIFLILYTHTHTHPPTHAHTHPPHTHTQNTPHTHTLTQIHTLARAFFTFC